jgi:hypothetical protein
MSNVPMRILYIFTVEDSRIACFDVLLRSGPTFLTTFYDRPLRYPTSGDRFQSGDVLMFRDHDSILLHLKACR